MSNVLIGIIAVVLFIGLALSGAMYFGDRFSDATHDARAAQYVNEGHQIARAFELYGVNEGKFPDGEGETDPDLNMRIMNQMKSKGYLKSVPQGAQGGVAAKWYIDLDKGAAMTSIGTGSDAEAICQAARRKINISGPLLMCTDPALDDRDPCCTMPE
jgi:hypothetical protein